MTIEKKGNPWGQKVGIVLFVVLLGLILSTLFRDDISSGGMIIFIRWPLWVVLGIGVPFTILRIFFWDKLRRLKGPARGGTPSETGLDPPES